MGMIDGISGVSALSGLLGGTPASNVQMPATRKPFANTYAVAASHPCAYSWHRLIFMRPVEPWRPRCPAVGAELAFRQILAQTICGKGNATGQAGMQSGAGITGTALGQLPRRQCADCRSASDPQNALYSQLQNQNQQQNLAMLGQSGVAGTPYGQGVAGQQNTNFNIDWQNQQLQRAATGAGAAGSLLGSIGKYTNTGLGQMQQGAALPYQTSQGITGNQLGLLGQAGQQGALASQTPQMQIQDYLNYLSGATGQQGANNQTAQIGLNQAGMGFNQSQALGSQLGQSLAGLGKGWGTAFGGGSSGGGFANNAWGQANPGVAGSAFYGPSA